MKYEWIGIVGSIFIIFAFMNSEEKVIRLLDAVGAGCFVAYGALTHTWSTMFLNLVLIAVHIVKFARMRRKNGKRTESETKRIPPKP